MNTTAGWPDAVSVRYAREQYALGYVHGRGVDIEDAWSFARYYRDRCEAAGRLVDVHGSYSHWLAGARPVTQLALFS